jgi:hypothetical protein
VAAIYRPALIYLRGTGLLRRGAYAHTTGDAMVIESTARGCFWLERGAPIHLVEAILDHASVATTGAICVLARPTASRATCCCSQGVPAINGAGMPARRFQRRVGSQ